MFTPAATRRRHERMAARAVATTKRRPFDASMLRRGRAGLRPAQMMRPELNVIDTKLSSIAISQTHNLTLLNGCVQGSDSDQRIGRRIRLTAVSFDIELQVSATTLPGTYSMYLIHDATPAGVAPTAVELFEDPTNYATTTALNLANTRRFKVLRHFRGPLTGQSGAPTAHSQVIVKDYVKLNITTAFNAGVAGTIGDIETGALYLVTSFSQVAGANAALARGAIRVRFNNGR